MADENKPQEYKQNDGEGEQLEFDPLTGGRTVAQTPTDENDIQELPSTVDDEGNESRAGDFDVTTGAPHPSESAGND